MTIHQLLQGRFVSVPMLNDTGGVLAEGSVCYISDGQFKLTTTEGLSGYRLVVIPDEIPDGEMGRGIFVGHAVSVLLESPGNIDDFIITSTTSGKAKAVVTEEEGIFGCLLTAGAAPEVIVWGSPSMTLDHDHNSIYYTKTELQGDGLSEVHWNNLTNLPDLTVPMMAIFTLSGTLQTFTGALRITNKFGISRTISKVHLAVKDAPTSAAIIVDIHKDGTTIFTNQAHRPQIADAAYSGESTDIDVSTWADAEYLTMDIDQVGSVLPGGYLVVEVYFE